MRWNYYVTPLLHVQKPVARELIGSFGYLSDACKEIPCMT